MNVVFLTSMTLIVKVISFYKETLVASNFGMSILIDTFLIAMLVPGLISNVFLGSFNSVFIPNYISELKSNNKIGSFQSASFLITLGLVSFFAILSVLFTDIFLENFYSGHDAEYYRLVKVQFYYILPSILFGGLSSTLSGLLNIDHEFKLTSYAGVIMPLSTITCLLFFKESLGELVLAVGVFSGSVLGFVYLFLLAWKRNLIKIGKLDFRNQGFVLMFKQLPAKVSSSLLSGLNPLIDQYFSAQLVIGSIASLSYGAKIPSFTIAIVGGALGTVLLPYFSHNAAEDRIAAYKKLKKILRYAFIGGLAALLFLFFLSHPIISMLFERNAFTSSDTDIVSRVQQMYLLQVPFYVIGIIMVRYLTAINKNSFMVIASMVNVILNVILNTILIRRYGVYGLALATSLVSMVNTLLLYIYIRKISKAYV